MRRTPRYGASCRCLLRHDRGWRPLRLDPAQKGDESEAKQRDGDDDYRQRDVAAWPVGAGSFAAPKNAKGGQYDSDDELHGVLWYAGQWGADRDPGDGDEEDSSKGRYY